MEDNKELTDKLELLKKSNEENMARQMDTMIRTNIETNRAKCLDMAITSLKAKDKELFYEEVRDLAEKYYRWVCKI